MAMAMHAEAAETRHTMTATAAEGSEMTEVENARMAAAIHTNLAEAMANGGDGGLVNGDCDGDARGGVRDERHVGAHRDGDGDRDTREAG